MRRRIVYLDTQDYSRLTDAVSGRGNESLIPIYEQLRKFAHDGAFDFCFSYMIISELLRLNPNDIEIARRKSGVTEELCGPHGFPIVFWLLGAELVTAAERRGFAPLRHSQSLEEVVFGGQWIRTELSDAETMFAGLDEKVAKESNQLIQEKLGRSLNRKERRGAAKHGTMGDARRIVESTELYPIIAGTELVDKFAGALMRRQSLSAVSEQFFRFIARPTRLVLAHDHLSSLGFLNDHIETLKAGITAGLAQLRDNFDALQEAHGSQSRATRAEMMREPLDKMLINLPKGLKDHFARYGVPPAYIESPWFDEDVTSLPFISLWRDLLTPYLLAVTDDSKTRRVLQPSDIVDFMHALYIPHCAVWRSDRFFADLASPIANRLGCRVVSKLVDLPKVLNEILDGAN